MAYSRYTARQIFLNNDRNYKNSFFDKRGINETYQYDTPRLTFPDEAQVSNLNNEIRIWTATDKLYNLSNQYYGSPQYWWVIAWYNQKASEAEFKIGDTFFIPQPLEDVLGFIG